MRPRTTPQRAAISRTEAPLCPRHRQGALEAFATGAHTTNCTSEFLALTYQATGCPRCLEELVRRNEDLVQLVTRRLGRMREPDEDIAQSARLGLLKAAKRYRRDQGAAFSTYAVSIMEGEVRHHLRDAVLMRQPRWARMAYRSIEESTVRFYQDHGRFPSLDELTTLTNMSPDVIAQVNRAMEQPELRSSDPASCLSVQNLPFNRAALRCLEPTPGPRDADESIALHEAVRKLPRLDRLLVYLVFFRDLTQQEAGYVLGLSQRAVSRQLKRALASLRRLLSSEHSRYAR